MNDAVKKYAKQLVASIEKASPFPNSRVTGVSVEEGGTLSVRVQVQPVFPVQYIKSRFLLTPMRERLAICTGEQVVEFRITPKLVTGDVKITDGIAAKEVIEAVVDHYRKALK